MRALIHFMYRGGWSFQILAAGCETLLIGYRRVQKQTEYPYAATSHLTGS
jgi:hypothetical protein